jgi:hypothetical protein
MKIFSVFRLSSAENDSVDIPCSFTQGLMAAKGVTEKYRQQELFKKILSHLHLLCRPLYRLLTWMETPLSQCRLFPLHLKFYNAFTCSSLFSFEIDYCGSTLKFRFLMNRIRFCICPNSLLHHS